MGRSEFVPEVLPAGDAPPLRERLQRAREHLREGGLGLLVGQPGAVSYVQVHGNLLDCVSRERYDAWELTAFVNWLGGRPPCAPIAYGAADATGVLLRPIPLREKVEVRAWLRLEHGTGAAEPAIRFSTAGAKALEMTLEEAASSLSRTPSPLVAVMTPAANGRGRLVVVSAEGML